MKKKFIALRIVGTVYKILGILMALLAVLGAIGLCAGGALGGGLASVLSSNLDLGPFSGMLDGAMDVAAILLFGLAIGGIIYSLMGALTLYGLGELVYLFLALEENTRATADLLQRCTVSGSWGNVIQAPARAEMTSAAEE